VIKNKNIRNRTFKCPLILLSKPSRDNLSRIIHSQYHIARPSPTNVVKEDLRGRQQLNSFEHSQLNCSNFNNRWEHSKEGQLSRAGQVLAIICHAVEEPQEPCAPNAPPHRIHSPFHSLQRQLQYPLWVSTLEQLSRTHLFHLLQEFVIFLLFFLLHL